MSWTAQAALGGCTAGVAGAGFAAIVVPTHGVSAGIVICHARASGLIEDAGGKVEIDVGIGTPIPNNIRHGHGDASVIGSKSPR
jgi:hypothetical protein